MTPRPARLQRRNDTDRSLRSASKYDDAVPLDLAHAAVVQQQVDVAEHLGQRQVGLRDRDVAEQRLRELVAGARALGDQARRSSPRAGAWNSKPLVDQRDVVGDRLAVARTARSRPAARASCAATRCR